MRMRLAKLLLAWAVLSSHTFAQLPAAGNYINWRKDAALALPSMVALPAGWLNTDIGTVGGAGAANESSGTYTLSDRGKQIYDRADSGQFAYRHTASNGVITARVATMAATADYGQAGVMIRETLRPDAKYIGLFVTKTKGLQLLVRANHGGDTAVTSVASIAAPYYVRITRSGLIFTPEYSANGSTWTPVGGASRISMISQCVFGLGTSSHDTAVLRDATFDNVSTTFTSDGTHYYVSATAAGGGNGSWATPWRLPEALITNAGSIPAGSTVWLREGTSNAKIATTLGGTSGSRTKLREYPGERFYLDGNTRPAIHLTSNLGTSGCGFTVDNVELLQPGVAIHIDNEDILVVNAPTGNTVNSCARAWNGTVASAHTSGTGIGMFDSVLILKGAYLDVHDIEVLNSDNSRQGAGLPYPGGDADKWPTYRGPGISVQAANVRLFHVVVHDNADGISAFQNAGGGLEVFGGLIYNNGTWGTNRPPNNGNGQGTYFQNLSSNPYLIHYTTSINNGATAFKAGGNIGAVDNIVFNGVIAQHGGALGARGEGKTSAQYAMEVVPDAKPIVGSQIINSVIVGLPKAGSPAVQYGYTPANNKGGALTNNVITSGGKGIAVSNWRDATIQGNTVYITNGDPASQVEMANFRFTNQPLSSGTVDTNGTTVTYRSDARFNYSWATGCTGCPNSITINGTTYTIAPNSVADDGGTLTLTASAGVQTNVAYSVPLTEAHPATVTFNGQNYYSGVALNDQGTTGSSDSTRTDYQFAFGEFGVSPSNRLGGGSLRFHPDCVSGTNEDRAFQRWSAADIPAGTGTVNRTGTAVTWVTGTPFSTRWVGQTITINAATFTVASVASCTALTLASGSGSDSAASYSVAPANTSSWTQGKPSGTTVRFFPTTAEPSARGHVAFSAAFNWQDAGTITLTSANLSTVLATGDRFEVRKAECYECPPLVSQIWNGGNVLVPTTDLTVTPPIGLGFVPLSSFPRFGALIVIRK